MYYRTALSNGEASRVSLRLARLSVTDSLIRILIARCSPPVSQGIERLEYIGAHAEGSFKMRFARLITPGNEITLRSRAFIADGLRARRLTSRAGG